MIRDIGISGEKKELDGPSKQRRENS